MISAGAIKTEDGYACPLMCGEPFTTEGDAKRHAKQTCVENDYCEKSRCPLGVCGKELSRLDAVKRHLRKVHKLTKDEVEEMTSMD
jgi:hypothetical protein